MDFFIIFFSSDGFESSGVKHGHVQQMILRMNPSSAGSNVNRPLHEIDGSAQTVRTHQPVIKGA